MLEKNGMVTVGWYIIAALGEISGCFAFWAWLRLDRSWFWLIPGFVSLTVFAYALTRVDSDFAGRAYAAYGGIYIMASVSWLWVMQPWWNWRGASAGIPPGLPRRLKVGMEALRSSRGSDSWNRIRMSRWKIRLHPLRCSC